ncbi:uncharacterized protein [Primulina eburnea]|uniref:uncharacterized protein isoform X1 n=1 Tax=Primulina eburnea TaxID=1245227 RepID=UPI003C6C4B7F
MSSSKSEKYPWPSTVNAANFVSVKLCLNKDNKERGINDYKIWKKQMICLFESQDLLGFIDGQIPAPEDSMDEQKLWRRTDQLVTGWILGSITGTDVLDAVVGLKSSMEVWLELEKLFKSDNNEIQSDMEKDEDEDTGDESESSSSSSSEEEDAATGKDLSRYLSLYRAALRGDWKEGKKILDKDENAITAIVNGYSETTLHVAVETGKSNYFVKKLLEYPIPDEAILAKSSSGDTALHFAAMAGNKEAAIMLVSKNPDLLYIANKKNRLPIHLAARNSQKDTLMYLISVSKKDVGNSPFVGKFGAQLLTIAITSEFMDVASYLVKKYPELAALSDEDGDYALKVIAGMKSVFPSGQTFSWWQNWIYSCVPLTSSSMEKITTDIENPCYDDQVQKKFDWFQIISFVVPGAKSLEKKKLMHQQTLELVKCLCKALESLPNASGVYESAIVKAARKGIHEVVELIIEMFPTAIFADEPKTGCTIFHVAARERVDNVFNLIYHMSERKHYFYDSTDSSDNNFMHTCGEIAPSHKLNLVSGAALQMQRELQWFKEMEKFVNPSRRTWENSKHKTPQMLFTEKHHELKSEGEKWMKDTASSCTIAAALITTVVFAAAFTVPGGLHSDSGVPVFVKEPSFIVFAVSNSVSMFTSTTSLLMFLSILTSRYAEQDFLNVLPKRLCIGLLTLFTSITFMMVAFSAAIYVTFKDKSSLFVIPMAALACLPVGSFVLLQFPLLITLMYSTYGPGIFQKKSDRTLY